jgi:hypothetical protein
LQAKTTVNTGDLKTMKNFKITYLGSEPFYRTAKDIEEIKNQLADEDWKNESLFEWMDDMNYLTREDYKNNIHKYYKIKKVA